VDTWLSDAADALAAAAAVDRAALELDPETERVLLELARIAAHESGDRTNAPLLCFLAGRATASGAAIDDLADAVRRSTS
jgi:uncharacterized protein DUF6457